MSEHKSLAAALLAFQQNPPHIPRNGVNPAFKSAKSRNGSPYATLEDAMGALRPALSEQGLCYLQPLDNIDGAPAIRNILIHAATGERIESVTPLLLGGKTDPQSHGSGVTYGRRYSALSFFGLVGDEDDDGNAASAAPSPARTSADTAGAGSPTPSLPAPADDIPFGEPAPEQQTFAAPGDAITDKQKSKIHVVMTKLSEGGVVSVEQFRAHMDATYGVTSTKELTKKQASELTEWLVEKEAA